MFYRIFVAASILVVLLLVVFLSAAFVVDESNQVFITQFGKPVRSVITEPGIKFKLPFIQKAHFFDKRYLEWDGDPNQIPTRDKRYISVNTYARWRIQDPLLFFQQVTDERGAQTRLDDVLDGATRNAVASHDLVEIVRSQVRRNPENAAEPDFEDIGALAEFSFGRERIAQQMLDSARPQLLKWGIELLDIRFKRINYEQDVQLSIFERMISERQRIAAEYRSEGQGEAARILGERERDLKTIESTAFQEVQEIEGEGDAKAAAIYAAAYNQSPEAREFYKFLKTMETYGASISGRDSIVLSTKSDLFRYLTNPSMEAEQEAP